MSEPMSTPAAAPPPQDAVAPPTNRRPRVREVSSRFMNATPVPSGEHPALQQQPHKTPKHSVSTPMPAQKMQRSKTDNPHHQETLIRRSYSDSPFTLHNYNKVPPPRPRGASTRLVFKENKGVRSEGSDNDDCDAVPQLRMVRSSSSRPDTPATQRIVPSRFRQSGNTNLMHASAAAKLLQSSGLSFSSAPQEHLGDAKATEDDEDGCTSKSCPNSPLPIQNNSLQWNSDVRSSMPERTCFGSTNGGESQLSSKLSSASPCSRSLNLLNSSVKAMGFNLSLPPPHPMPLTKQGDVARKGRKLSNREEQVHSLKMLHNHYLQWIFVNAKSQASFHAQTRDAEGKLYSLGAKISDLSAVVRRKRMELEYLKRIKTLTTIVENQIPYLDEWSALEEEHSSSLSGTSQALINSVVRLPLGGNVQADTKEVGEALTSAMKVMETIYVQVQKFLPKASEMDTLSSELARSVAGERVLIDECGDLLLKTYTSQVEDCSLRGHLMQLKKSNLILQ
ncbi:hypothetical protein DCAR_0623203 [Daucus carota subsp. sativus]|uniref:Protein ENDOSPERM DEFECTIVE 1 n=1 Tax=Daucus carota subsp. sativus TaxID=79200 RepID=A0AAF1B401_DAUCS|nr:PREDICTED: protein ENDOSPERM DEFECTIVE 1 [Daucus carota subsp. sativus]WOH03803.1 hypothetical protein DCAR_0623203 [Daucus carota subsp. sativus]